MSRAGRKSFDKCNVKVVEFKEFVYASTFDKDLPGVERKTVRTDNPSEDTRVSAGNGAVLHCPMTEDTRVNIESQYTNHASKVLALDSLKYIAGEVICRNCRYSSMSAVEVAQEQATVARAEADKLEALSLRRQALEDLQEHDPDFRIQGE
jgi:hypothetical protein